MTTKMTTTTEAREASTRPITLPGQGTKTEEASTRPPSSRKVMPNTREASKRPTLPEQGAKTKTASLSLMMVTLLFISACGVGGQTSQTQARSAQLGDQSEGVSPPARNWKAAATGYGAAGTIPSEVLKQMDERSARGVTRPPDPSTDQTAPAKTP